MERANHPGLDPGTPHALDHSGYAAGFPRPEVMLLLEAADPFWQTLGGSTADPFGDGGAHFSDRAKAIELGLGANIYGRMTGLHQMQSQNSDSP
jgi:hypothetical protein